MPCSAAGRDTGDFVRFPAAAYFDHQAECDRRRGTRAAGVESVAQTLSDGTYQLARDADMQRIARRASAVG